MIQGTCSNAGKSLLVAALCRIFVADGFSPVPFKSQNMALNSFVTDQGEEMGRAQALQALAAGLAPDVRMNPILLKPHSDMGSQVIVMGKPYKHMRVKEYIAYKKTAFSHVAEAYDSLAQHADIMVIEGAGSPAEINLKSHDIVNMAMAAYAKSPVLLCADIDRGGAFAALVGTMALLDNAERDMVKGFILNKFRGDASLLDSAIERVSADTTKPFMGVVPYIKNLHLPDEDSVSFRLYGQNDYTEAKHIAVEKLDVALIDVPHISNATDVDALRVEPDVRLRIVRKAEDMGRPNILILPGTKNTAADLDYLRAQGFVQAMQDALPHIHLILGICGGLQMLGKDIVDTHGQESSQGRELLGLGLLPLRTEFLAQKTLRRCEATYVAEKSAPKSVVGYEIHHGHTTCLESVQVVLRDKVNGSPLGWQKMHGKTRVMGTYVHGLLDADAFRRTLLDEVRKAKGLAPLQKIHAYNVQASLDILAQAVREALDMPAIYKLMGL